MVFFFGSTGGIKVVNRTETKGWGDPQGVTEDSTALQSNALAVCVHPKLVQNPIRVFYGAYVNGSPYIVESGGHLDGSSWDLAGPYFGNSDARSGVACSVHADRRINLYFHNTKYNVIKQCYSEDGDYFFTCGNLLR